MVLHVHGAMYKERQLFTSGNKDIKHAKEMLKVLEAVNLLNQTAIMYCSGYQNIPQTSQGNQTVNKTAMATTSWGFNSPPGLVRI